MLLCTKAPNAMYLPVNRNG